MNQYKLEHKEKADHFWHTYFGEYSNALIDGIYARNIEFWDKLATALEAEDIDVIHAVILTPPSINIANPDLHIRIVRTAKDIWDKKQSA